eukprot:TRINITY_DN10201_c0_g1_i3.p1 TRINITY_DN10201_c0_g1~~TRINITY_DN10201_c0_g1_i3.p1  ORF type:complete len:573 (-),score=171.20 TRINITY_DN10201_c0_g1_i3:355-1929(-)
MVKREAEENEFLRHNNIKTVVSALDSYYQSELGLPGQAQDLDSSAIAREGNVQEIQKLVQLILGAAVECDEKIKWIGNIMKMEPASQRQLMVLIEQILNNHQKEKSLSMDRSDVRNHAEDDDFFRELDEKATFAQQNEEHLKQQFKQLQSDYDSLQSAHSQQSQEKEALLEMVRNLEESLKEAKAADPLSPVPQHKEDPDLARRAAEVERLLSEESRLHSELDIRDGIIADLKKKLEEANKQSSQVRQLQDELDILREKSAHVDTLEDRLKKFEKRVESIQDLKRQIQLLEEQNEGHLKTKIVLEEAAKKIPLYKTQLERYKEQLTALTAEGSSSASLLEDKNAEVDTLRLDNEKLVQEVKNKATQIERLKAQMETMKQEQESTLLRSPNESFSERITDLSAKETIMRLQLENTQLKAGSGNDEKVMELENKLDDADRLNKKYQKDLEVLKKRVKEVEAAPATDQADHSNTQEVETLKTDLAEAQAKVAQLEELSALLKESRKGFDAETNAKIASQRQGQCPHC